MRNEQYKDTDRKTTTDYWDENWRRASKNNSDESGPKEHDSYYWRRMHSIFTNSFETLDTANCSLIEVGAGASDWLPYLHHRFGFGVAGLDYSEVGCQAARENLLSTSTPGFIHRGDMFAPPLELRERFDVAVSLGLVEHFENTTAAVSACANFVKPGGLVFTLIPNMNGLYGALYKLFNRKVYDIHVPITLKELIRAHRDAGLNVFLHEHILGVPGVIDQQRIEPVFVRRALRKLVFQFSRVAWALEEKGWGVPENPFSSPYMVCVARKPKEPTSISNRSKAD